MSRIAPSWLQLIAVSAAFAQVPAPTVFDVASIKPNRLNDHIVTLKIGPGGRFTTRGYTLQLLIQQAYGVQGFQISGGPAWLDEDRYDVTAKVTMAGNLTDRKLRPLLQALLAERFHLQVKTGSKEMAGYALVVARGGPKIQLAASGEEHPETIRMSGVGFKGDGITPEMLAGIVQSVLGFPVVDKTELKGVYDIKVNWTEQYARTLDTTVADAGPAGSTIFTAVQDQLGFKLIAQKVRVPTLVIEHAEKASEN